MQYHENIHSIIDYSSPASIKDFLKSSNFAMQKKWGQNFLIDAKMRENIMEMLGEVEGQNIWEVGPGLGAMTHLLAKKNVNLTLFEIDSGFLLFLNNAFCKDDTKKTNASIRIVEGDVLKTWKNEMEKKGLPDIFFGCLPYNITIELLLSLFKKLAIFDKMLITVQKEVAQKMLAKENRKEYAPLSVFTNYFYECKGIKDIPPSCFWPQPKVTSTVVFLTKKRRQKIEDEALFVRLVSYLFSSRRRTIKNNLNAMLKQQKIFGATFNNTTVDVEELFDSLKIDSSLRAENLREEDFIAITNKLFSLYKITIK